MRLPHLLAALAAAALSVPVATAPATAETAPGPQPVGGARLASHGLVVDALPGVPEVPTGLTASSWLVADLDTGAVLAARDAHARHLPASTLKVLTAETLIPRLNPDATAVPTWDDVAVDGSKVGLVEHLAYPIRQLFTAMLVVSGNDAADTLATAAGGQARTLALMNREAARLQAYDTHAVTPSGLDGPGQHTSAYDLALIARAAMRLPAFRQYVAIKQSWVAAPHGERIQIYTHNRLLTHYPGAIGVKNGWTDAARATFVGAATRGGHTLVVTLMHADPAVWKEAERLLDWGFAAYGHVRPVGTLVDPLPAPAPAPATHARAAASVGAPADPRTGRSLAPLPLGLGVSGAILFTWTYGGRAVRWRRRVRRRRADARLARGG